MKRNCGPVSFPLTQAMELWYGFKIYKILTSPKYSVTVNKICEKVTFERNLFLLRGHLGDSKHFVPKTPKKLDLLIHTNTLSCFICWDPQVITRERMSRFFSRSTFNHTRPQTGCRQQSPGSPGAETFSDC